MNSKDLVQKLSKKKVQDYSFTILFFFIFSFFVIFAIRPNILTAFNLQRELHELEIKDRTYENIILSIVDYQTILEGNRDNFSLLDEAVPPSIQMHTMIDGLKRSSTETGIILNTLNVNEINLKGTAKKKGLQQFAITMDTQGTMEKMKGFIDNFMNQRRLKTLKSLSISQRDPLASGSAQFSIQLEVEGYNL